MQRLLVPLPFVLALACVTPEPSASREPLCGPSVETLRTLSTPPEAGDGPALVEVRVTDARGDEHVFAPVVGAVAWGEGALLLGADRTLSIGLGTGERTEVDRAVTFVPVVTPGGEHVVYARNDDGTTLSLVVRSRNGSVTLAEGLASIGAIHFVDSSRFVFVGGRSGGVAGLWRASTDSEDLAVCLTNCTLRTGQPWGDAFVPLPAELDDIALTDDGALR